MVDSLTTTCTHTGMFDLGTLPLYFLGFCTFLITILDDWVNPKKCFKSFLWYVQDFFYTLISIALGISVCYALEWNQSVSWIVSVFMGLCGSTIIRKIRGQKDEICDKLIDSLTDKAQDKINKNKSEKQ